MKKFLALLLALLMVLSLVACGSDTEEPTEEQDATAAEDTAAEDTTEETTDEEVAAPVYKLGMGVVVSVGSSKAGTAQADDTVAVVVTDADGKIVACKIDVAQTKVDVTDGVLGDLEAVDLRSKQEKKEDYGMVAHGGAIAEWYEQANAFAAAVIGMTGEEVAAIETVQNGEHMVAADPDIYASCTMQITDFMKAIEKACNDEYAKTFEGENWVLGLGLNTAVDESTAPADDADGTAALYTNFAAAVVGNDGVILADLVDVAQVKVTFDATGEITTDTAAYGESFRTKKELKDDYNMVKYGSAIAEWMDQATAFENYIVNMTIDQVNGIATTVNEEGHAVVTDADPDLLAACTMAIADFQATLTKAVAQAG